MALGIFIIESDEGITSSNGAYINYKDNDYLITCAHTFYDKKIKQIHFIIDPMISGKTLHGRCHLKNLNNPIFHKDDTDVETYEVGVIKINKEAIQQLFINKINPSVISLDKPELRVDQNIFIVGYDTNLMNTNGFNGRIKLSVFELPYVLNSKRIVGPHPKSSRVPIDCYVLAKKSNNDLGEGFSGSILTINNDEIIGLYHTSAAPLKNGFDKLTPKGCAIFCSAKRVRETIEYIL